MTNLEVEAQISLTYLAMEVYSFLHGVLQAENRND